MKKWIKYNLNEVCKIGDGNHSSNYPKSGEMVSDGVPFIRANNLVNGEVVINDMKYISPEKHKILRKGHLKAGDILFTNRGEIGKVAILSSEFDNSNLNSQIAWFRCLEKINNRFLYYFLISPSMKNYYSFEKNGAALQQFTIGQINKIEINLPSLSEQQSIVDKLDKALAAIDKAKANMEKNLQNVRELYESNLESVFSNIEGKPKKLKDICEISSKLIDPRKKEFQNLIHIGAGNIESKTGELFELKTAKEENLISGKFLFDESMVLYSKIRPYLMKAVKCEFSGLCSADIYPLKPFDDIVTKDFLYQILLSKDFTDYAILGSQRAGMPKVNREHLFEYEVILPSIQKQKVIVKNLDLINYELKRVEKNYRSKLSNLVELKKVILGKAFRGEL